MSEIMERIIPLFYSIFDFMSQPMEATQCCNLCGSQAEAVIQDIDRYGFPQRAVKCPGWGMFGKPCGLVYLNPRMTAAAYREFYESGAYRRLVSAYHGREINAETIQPEQHKYGKRVAALLKPHMFGQCYTLLDVGGSTGVVAGELERSLGVSAWVLDPAEEEIVFHVANRRIKGTAETFEPNGRQFNVVTLCQTVDHLLDPMAALRKIHDMLTPGGLFWVDALDYDRTRTIKIDHPYNFTERTMRAYLDKVGFAVLQTVRDGDHVGFVCRKAA